MKKYIIFVIVLGSLVFGFSTHKVQAVTLNDLQKQIATLSQQINSLKLKLTGQVISSGTTNLIKNTNVSSTSVAKPYFNRSLQLGSKGEDVQVLQYILGIKGSGVFGTNTDTVLKNWQKKNNLNPDGVLAGATMSAMEESVKKMVQSTDVIKPYGSALFSNGGGGVLGTEKEKLTCLCAINLPYPCTVVRGNCSSALPDDSCMCSTYCSNTGASYVWTGRCTLQDDLPDTYI
jgi:hypothetical protein